MTASQGLEELRRQRFGLDPLADCHVAAAENVDGPEGRGAIVCAGQAPRYDPLSQRWGSGGGGAWVGISSASRPRAGELVRPQRFEGHDITLRGDRWTVPVLFRFSHTHVRYVLHQDIGPAQGLVAGVIGDVFRMLRIDRQAPRRRIMAAAAIVLSVNYRTGAEEIALAELFDERAAAQICALAIDSPSIPTLSGSLRFAVGDEPFRRVF